MATWKEFERANPDLAAFGTERVDGVVAYLATVGNSGLPRVYPVTPIIGGGHLFVFMEPTSPKGRDLRRNGQFALHSSVSDTEGGQGEFSIQGRGALVGDPGLRVIAVESSSYSPAERYILFELFVRTAMSTVYRGDQPVRSVWRKR